MVSLNGWFEGMSGLTEIDIRNLNTNSLERCDSMFKDCSNLITIYDEDDIKYAVSSSTNMFLNCINLVGGYGTAYDYRYVDDERAKLDTPTQQGYFSSYEEPVDPPAYTYKLLFSTENYPKVENMYKSIIEPSNEQSITYEFSYSNIQRTMEGVKGEDPKRTDGYNF